MKVIGIKICFSVVLSFLLANGTIAQPNFQIVDNINLASIPLSSIRKLNLKMIDNTFGEPICIPVYIAKGKKSGPVLGLTAAIHGNELNGIRIIQSVFDSLNLSELAGTIIAIPGLNPVSISLAQREYSDGEDLNRIFPGNVKGDESQQFVWQITKKLLPQFTYLIDMHTASFGRENTFYVRGDMSNVLLAKIAEVQPADIILDNKGTASTANASSDTRTLRAEAEIGGIPTVTIEYGNPQVYQTEMIERGITGIFNAIAVLNMIPKTPIRTRIKATQCKKSYWTYVDRGGLLEIPVQLNQRVKKGEVIGVQRNPFGDVIKTYYCPEDGIVIGRSTNPVNTSGGRIIHLGILK